MTAADVVIVGGGIAGLSAAYFAAKAGRDVTVVDEGVHRASDLPIALINPLRGATGRLVAGGVDGMHASFALIDALRRAGHAIDGGRGLHRPLVGVAADAARREVWVERIGRHLAFDWHDEASTALGLVDRVPSLFVRDAGWVAPRGLLAALRIESRATILVDRATGIDGARVTLASGTTLVARTVLWCGGAWGGALLDAASTADDALYKPGSLVAVDAAVTTEPLTFGLYAVPSTGLVGAGPYVTTLVGPTREGSQSRFDERPLPDEALDLLADRLSRMFGSTRAPRPVWRGMRLARLSSHATLALHGTATLTALGSRGFLMAPLQAARWARSL